MNDADLSERAISAWAACIRILRVLSVVRCNAPGRILCAAVSARYSIRNETWTEAEMLIWPSESVSDAISAGVPAFIITFPRIAPA